LEPANYILFLICGKISVFVEEITIDYYASTQAGCVVHSMQARTATVKY
jgi:hypothetical protein